MAQVRAGTSGSLPVSPQRAYEALADYRGTRRDTLPSAYTDYEVEQGGQGEGTVAFWNLHAGRNRVRPVRARVSEPEPGRVLVEQDENSTMMTTYTVRPEGSDRSRVEIETTWQGASGVGGFFERTFAPRGLQRIYDEFLDNLAGRVG